VLVEGEVGHELLQLGVLVLELPETPELGTAQPGVLPLPAVERLLRDAHLATDLRGGRAGLDAA
jgi:hypothetical protein